MYIKTNLGTDKLIRLYTLETSDENLAANKSTHFFQVVKTSKEKGVKTMNKVEIAINNTDIPSTLLIKLLKIIDHWVEKDGSSRDAKVPCGYISLDAVGDMLAKVPEASGDDYAPMLRNLAHVFHSKAKGKEWDKDKLVEHLKRGKHGDSNSPYTHSVATALADFIVHELNKPQEPAEAQDKQVISLDGMNRILTYIQRSVTESSKISESQAIDFANILEHLIFVTQTMDSELPTREEIIQRFNSENYSQDYPELGETIADLLHTNIAGAGEPQAPAEDEG